MMQRKQSRPDGIKMTMDILSHAMKKMPAGEFKSRCLTVMDDVRKTREPVLITKRGKPVAKLVPADKTDTSFLGCLEIVVRITGDIESPIEPPEAWEALR
jgi:prevent-host-death family protein